jgi:phosphoribosylanthranilate isomerase
MKSGSMSLWIKICGVTSIEDAELAVSAGADAVGVNLVPSSKRRIDRATARSIVLAVGDRAEVVAVVADEPVDALFELKARLGVHALQLHGNESPALLAELAPHAFRAVRIGTTEDVAQARLFGGTRLLADAKVAGALGGTGHAFDWTLVTELARERALVLAGGLRPDNVAAAVALVRPFGVDTASGVEGADPRKKDADKVLRFVEAARRAAREAGLDSARGVDYEPGRNP